MSRDDAYVRDRIENAGLARQSVGEISFDVFRTDTMRYFAVARCFEIIGEAANRISPERKAKIVDLPWKQIIGMRHRVIHDYMNVDLDVMWDAIKYDLPGMITILEASLSEMQAGSPPMPTQP